MAQAEHVSNAVRAPITGANAKPSTNPTRPHLEGRIA
jgi:hypothetical protein